jgi:hypothetical protein
MSVSDDLYMEAEVSREELSGFLTDGCGLQIEATSRPGMPIYSCEDFSCHLLEASNLGRDLIKERFGFVPVWHLSFNLKDIPHHDSHPAMIQAMQLLMLQYDSDCVWLTNGNSPQLLKRRGMLTIQGAHSPYSHWADYLRRIAGEMCLPFEVKAMPVK